MARVRMVTRTVDTTVCEVMTINVTTATVKNISVTVNGKYEDKSELLRVIQKNCDSDTVKHVSVISFENKETLYGMPESKFIELAEELPPRKVYGEDTDSE